MSMFLEYLRGWLLTLWLRHICHCKVGKGLRCQAFPHWYRRPKGNFNIGDHCSMGRNLYFLLRRKGKIETGSHIGFGGNAVWGVNTGVTVGDHVMFAHFYSIRDADHGMVLDIPMDGQKMDCAPISIGDDCWVCDGARILKGAHIPNGCVIAANAVIHAKLSMESGKVYGGVPAKEISRRKSSSVD